MAPIAINGLAFKALSYLASSCVFFPWLLPMLFPPPRMHSQAPSPLFGILLIHQINVTSPEKPPQFLPGKKNLTSVLEQQRMTHVDLRWALVSYSMKYVRQGPSSLRIEWGRITQHRGSQSRVHTPQGVPKSFSEVGEVKIILLIILRQYLTFSLFEISIDGIKAIEGKIVGALAQIKAVTPNNIRSHCICHCQALPLKKNKS